MQVFMVGIEQARNLAAAVLVAATATSAAAQSPAPAVLVAPAQMKALSRQTELGGRVEAVEKVDLRARATGFLSARSFKEGDTVKVGQVLFEIEPEPFQAAVDQRQAQLAGAQAALENARLQLERGRELGRTNAIAQAQIDQRVADEARASASVRAAVSFKRAPAAAASRSTLPSSAAWAASAGPRADSWGASFVSDAARTASSARRAALAVTARW